MADLTFTMEPIPQIPTTALVKISGTINAKTVVLFQEKLDQLQSNNYTRFILDMEGIKYVNSTGLGTLVNVADALENKGGGIALIKIHPKVKVVFDMLGLNAFFKIFSNEDEALGYLGVRPSPSAPPTKTSQPTTSSAPAPANTYPMSVVCEMCKVQLKIPKPGSYKCPRCGTFFKLADKGVNFVKREKIPPLQFKLACTDECTEGLCEFVGVIASRIGFTPEATQEIKGSVREICGAVIEKAYENKQYLSYNVVMTVSSTDLKIQFSDFGKYIYDDNLSFAYTKRTMPEFMHKEHPRGGNIIDVGRHV